MLSKNEEDYLKVLFHLLTGEGGDRAGTNQLAQQLEVKPASANSMLKRLSEKKLVEYQKYSKPILTPLGRATALQLIRRHRLWETFLFQKLNFAWDEVHEVAEQLEHVQSEKLIEQLDRFLGYPKFDPHGDPIPDAQGNMAVREYELLANIAPGQRVRITGMKDSSTAFLQYLNDLGLALHSELLVLEHIPFDNSLRLALPDGLTAQVSEKFALHVFVLRLD